MTANTPIYAVRRATERDIDAIVRVDREARPEAWSAAGYMAALRSATAVVLVAEGGQKVVGVLCGAWCADTAALYNVAVARDHRRRGIAGMLLRTFSNVVGDVGVGRIVLEVRRSNNAAIRLYQAHGWLVEGLRPGYYDQPREDALVMAKEVRA